MIYELNYFSGNPGLSIYVKFNSALGHWEERYAYAYSVNKMKYI